MRYGRKPRRLGRDAAVQERKGGLVKTMARLKQQRGFAPSKRNLRAYYVTEAEAR